MLDEVLTKKTGACPFFYAHDGQCTDLMFTRLHKVINTVGQNSAA